MGLLGLDARVIRAFVTGLWDKIMIADFSSFLPFDVTETCIQGSRLILGILLFV